MHITQQGLKGSDGRMHVDGPNAQPMSVGPVTPGTCVDVYKDAVVPLCGGQVIIWPKHRNPNG